MKRVLLLLIMTSVTLFSLELNGKIAERQLKNDYTTIYYANKNYFDITNNNQTELCNLSIEEMISHKNHIDKYYEKYGKIGDKQYLCRFIENKIVPNDLFCNLASSDDRISTKYTNTKNVNYDQGKLKFIGTWNIYYGNVKLEGQVEYSAPEYMTSGTPLLKVYMSETPFNGIGEPTGHLYCQLQLEQIKGGYVRTVKKSHISFTNPPAGTYYTVIALYEYTTGGYVLSDYLKVNGTRTFYNQTQFNQQQYYQQNQTPNGQDYSGLVQQYQYWDNQAKLYYQYLGQETNYSLRMSYLSSYKQAQAQMGQIRASSYGKVYIQQSPFETQAAPSNPNR